MPGTRRRSSTGPTDTTANEAALAEVAHAVDAMRAGDLVCLRDDAGSEVAVLAVETGRGENFRRFEDSGVPAPLLLLTHARARTLKMRLYTPEIVAIPLTPPLDPDRLRAIADPTTDLDEPLKGPFESLREIPAGPWPAAAKLAKLSGLLPAVVVGPDEIAPPKTVSISAETIDNYDDTVAASLKLVTRARVPLEGAEQTEVVAFRAANGEPEHYAVLVCDPARDRPVLARVHSECFTGDLLGSLRCDCGVQLRGAVEAIAKAGGGVLLYLAQEGRGIGLINKLRAYRLQDQGFDTYEANERLGFETDERLYGIAARMLALLGFVSVRLMTNNPRKVEALRAAGIEVRERVPHAFAANPHSRDYLRTKAEKAGHLL